MQENQVSTITNEAGLIIDKETGEVLGGEELALLLNLDLQSAQRFSVRDKESADWYVGRIVALQDEIRNFAVMAKKMIAHAAYQMRRLEAKYNGELRTYCEAELEKERTKTGKLKRKYVPFMRGAVYFRKSGGLRISDRESVQQWVDELSPDLFAKYGVRLVRKWNAKELKQAAATGENIPGFEQIPEHELGTMRIGTDKPWSPSQIKGLFNDITLALPSNEDIEDAEIT